MTSPAAQLEALHALTNEFIETRDQLKRLPAQLKAKGVDKEKLSQACDDLVGQRKQLRMNADKKQLSMESNEDRIGKLKVKLNMATSQKEFDAVKHEISKIEDENSSLEEEILEIFTQDEDEDTKLKDLKDELNVAGEKFDEFKKMVDYKKEKLESRLTMLQGKIDESLANLEGKTRAEYDRRLKIRGDETLAEALNGTCHACFTGQTPQAANQLRQGQWIICPSCGSMLYERGH